MPTAIEQALITLIPSVNVLQTELVQYAEALLNQSRLKASSLKADEEIGRIYACAHLACERSKTRLSLPEPKASPPVPPKVYKRLYSYLDGVLVVPSTPRTNRHVDVLKTPTGSKNAIPVSGRRGTSARTTPVTARQTTTQSMTGEDDTPSKRAEKRMRTPSSKLLDGTDGLHGSARTKRRRLNGAAAAPSWTAAMAVRLAEEFGEARVVPGVQNGLDAIIEQRGLLQDDDDQESSLDGGRLKVAELPAVIVVIALYVVAKLRGREVGEKEFLSMRRKAIDAVRTTDKGPSMEDSQMMDLTRRFMQVAGDEGWLQLPWFTSLGGSLQTEAETDVIVESLGSSMDNTGDDDLNIDRSALAPRTTTDKTPLRRREKHAPRPDIRAPEDTPAGLLPGLGTMFQNAVDWLSDDRRERYRVWHASIMARLDSMQTV